MQNDNRPQIPRTSLYVIDGGYDKQGDFVVRGVTFDKGEKKVLSVKLKNEEQQNEFYNRIYANSPDKAKAKSIQENRELSGLGKHNRNSLKHVFDKGLMTAVENKQIANMPETYNLHDQNIRMVMLIDNLEITHTNGIYSQGNATRAKVNMVTNNQTPSVNLRGMVSFHANNSNKPDEPLRLKLKLNEEAINLNGKQLTTPHGSRQLKETIFKALSDKHVGLGIDAERQGLLELHTSFTYPDEKGELQSYGINHKILPQSKGKSLSGEFKAETPDITINRIMNTRYVLEGENDPNNSKLKDNFVRMIVDYADNKDNMIPLPEKAHPLLKTFKEKLETDPKGVLVNLNVATYLPMVETLASTINSAKMSEHHKLFNEMYEEKGIPENQRNLAAYEIHKKLNPIPSLSNAYKLDNGEMELGQRVFPADITLRQFQKTEPDGTQSSFLAALHVSGVYHYVPAVEYEGDKISPKSKAFFNNSFFPAKIINNTKNVFITNDKAIENLIAPVAQAVQEMRNNNPLALSEEKSKNLTQVDLPSVETFIKNNPPITSQIIEEDNSLKQSQIHYLATYLGNKPTKKQIEAIESMTELEQSKLTHLQRDINKHKIQFKETILDIPENKTLYDDFIKDLREIYPNSGIPNRPENGIRNNIYDEFMAEAGFSKQEPRGNLLANHGDLIQICLHPEKAVKLEIDKTMGVDDTIVAKKAEEIDKFFEKKNSVEITDEVVQDNIDKLINSSTAGRGLKR